MFEAPLGEHFVVFGLDYAYFLLQVAVAVGELLLHALLLPTFLVRHALDQVHSKSIDFAVRGLKQLVEGLSIGLLAPDVNGTSQLLHQSHLIQFFQLLVNLAQYIIIRIRHLLTA